MWMIVEVEDQTCVVMRPFLYSLVLKTLIHSGGEGVEIHAVNATKCG